jgi:hypothetical protein
MKKNTLYFYLKSDENKFTFDYHEILEQILEQKANFEKENNYSPKYIRINKDLAKFLYKQTLINNNNLIYIKEDKVNSIDNDLNDNYARTIYGMEIKER